MDSPPVPARGRRHLREWRLQVPANPEWRSDRLRTQLLVRAPGAARLGRNVLRSCRRVEAQQNLLRSSRDCSQAEEENCIMSRELTRRDFLGDAALVGVASAIGLEKALAGQPTAAAAPPRMRRTSFDDGWSFAKGEIAGAQAPQFTGGVWSPVTIPHDWSIAGPFSE